MRKRHPEINGIKVYCKHTRIVPVEEVKLHPRNPNKHPPKQIDVLVRILRGNGWRLPCTVSKRSGYLTRGEGRFLAAQKLGLPSIPVDDQDYASEAEEIDDLIADNVAPKGAEIDDDILRDLIQTLDDTDHDLSLTGLDSDEISKLVSPIDDGVINTAPPLDEPPRMKKGRNSIVITYRDPDELHELNQYLGVDGAKRVYSASELLCKI